MGRFLYWLNRKKRIREKRCGQCCLTCPYYTECSADKYGEKVKMVGRNLKKSKDFFELTKLL